MTPRRRRRRRSGPPVSRAAGPAPPGATPAAAPAAAAPSGAVPLRAARSPRPAPGSDGAGLQIIPLGGLGEIGKNSVAIRLGREVLIVDAGLMFPDEEMLGIDFVIPDFRSIAGEGTVRGVVLTHGHEDHVGGLPFLLQTIQAPVYGTPLTLGLARRRVEETRGAPKMRDVPTEPRRPVRIGPFEIELVHVNHSIPQTCAVVVRTPVGTVVCTGDFKFDQTPIDDAPTDFARLAEVGETGVLVALMDSTNVERPGFAPSERLVGGALDDIFTRSRGRILVTTFASNVHRVQQILTTAGQHSRKVAIAGRSMVDTVTIASDLGVLKVPRKTLVPLEQVLSRFPQWRPQLEVLFDCQRLLGPRRAAPQFPAAGESLGDFLLLAELGRGAQGPVFLASQLSLGDRPVVLKLTPCDAHEHLWLARLQHTHIVPLYSVQDHPARGLPE